ncbi:DinB family protein [Lederbergia wuyishanensis]|uniref:Damage-inducible protein DinB n=1 Tax=Lederbergia wuyishanensis TaxID=1347903 RepID=A0ABU0D6S1_9BACI|nr:DinB family protein [Lederbergia wuyishanensis]MCJ8008550.1 DinB family protein [Lederbergia wuyishanensis]MDQ0344036.1 putative damage-inducible protein DinB [Lederbergia wuyishanensis]
MYTTIEDFLVDWGHESGSTQKILDVLTDESLSQEVSPQDRTLGRIAWHIVTTLDEMIGRTGLKFKAALHDSKVPQSAREITEAYKNSSDAMVTAIREQWTDDSLKEEKDMYGEMWSISTTLKVLITHQAHHRGQMTVLMRQAGLVVPGVYGPAREEWAAFGGQAPEV